MTDKEAIKYLQQLYPNGGHCWLDEQRIEAIGMAIDALKEEPASKVWHDASERPDYNVGKTVIVGYNNDDDLYDECNNVAYYITLSIFVSRKDLNTKVVRWAYLKDLI